MIFRCSLILAVAALCLVDCIWINAAEPESAVLDDLHPRMFELVACQLSDTTEPVVTEFNLQAIRRNRNQYDFEEIRSNQEWKEATGRDRQGFHRIRLLSSDGKSHRIEYQANTGGTLTSSVTIEFTVESRSIRIAGQPVKTQVLKITAISR